MEQQQATTPQDVAQPETQNFDDKILAKFGLGEPEEAEGEQPETPSADEPEAEPEVEVPEETPEPVGEFELKHNGELKKVPITEAQRLAQMGYDYEFKMQRVNQDAQRVQAMAQAVQARAAMQAQAIDALAEAKSYERQLQSFANVDWVQETNTDPVGAFQKRMQYDQLMQGYQMAQQRAYQLQQPIQQASYQIDQTKLALEAQKLSERIPEWRDGSIKERESKAILETLAKDYGFGSEEIGGPLMSDHRVIALLRDAWKYRQAVSGQKAKKGQIQGLPKVATPGAKPPPRTAAQDLGDIKRGLRQVQSKEARKALEDALIAKKFGLK